MSKFALGFTEKIKRNPGMLGIGRSSKVDNDNAGGGGALVVTITGDGVEYSCDKSPEEIYEAVMAGVPVSGVLVEDGTVYAMTLLETAAASTGVAYFRYVRYGMSGDATGKVFYLGGSEVSVYCEFCHVHTNRDPV